jgi:hypothetical protein
MCFLIFSTTLPGTSPFLRRTRLITTIGLYVKCPILICWDLGSSSWPLKKGPIGFPEAPVTTNQRYVTSQKSEDLIWAWNSRNLWV